MYPIRLLVFVDYRRRRRGVPAPDRGAKVPEQIREGCSWERGVDS